MECVSQLESIGPLREIFNYKGVLFLLLLKTLLFSIWILGEDFLLQMLI